MRGIPNIPAVITSPCEERLQHQLRDLFAIQEDALQPHHFLPHLGVRSLSDWMILGQNLEPNSNDYFWWLKGFTLVIYPYMPELGGKIWSALGYKHSPVQTDFFAQPACPLQKEIKLTLKRITHEFESHTEGLSYEPTAS
ncbi:methionyl-tRNA synthetase [Legionella cherrii]|uniref:Methionyl-tRNA synthetase n=1 Tax=Legionella cherrii TaxID=28084 RepID=A0A0W0SCI4_9GAMM|nr:methionyl-tRNA synthetase [Legionella cherrii]